MSEECELDVLYVSPEAFRLKPQVGVPCRMTPAMLAAYLSRPSVGDSKEAVGAWSPALYRDNVRRKSALVSIGALVVDVDENGDVDMVADVVSRYEGIVHETFSSTNDGPRCRIVLVLAEPVDAPAYERLHAVSRAHLRRAGILADEGAKDASRVSYSPVRRPGAGYRFRVLSGAPLDAHAVLAAHPKPETRLPAPPLSPKHRDRYIAAAMRRAAEEVSTANEGVRHYTLSREAFSLARLGLSDSEIEAALLPAFVARAGERRQREGVRTILDAVRARAGAA